MLVNNGGKNWSVGRTSFPPPCWWWMEKSRSKRGAQVSWGYRLVGCAGLDAKLKQFIQVQEAVDVEVKVLCLFHRCLLLCDVNY